MISNCEIIHFTLYNLRIDEVNMEQIITKNKSKSIKFIAVCLMITYHLFAFPARIVEVSYNSLFEIGGQTIEFYISRAGGICVGMFTFLSGYGLYIYHIIRIYLIKVFLKEYTISIKNIG